MANTYPLVGFHFLVTFNGLNGNGLNGGISFQEVSGLNVELEIETFKEGGENRYTHKFPSPPRYPDITLKRGMPPAKSDIFTWAKNSIELFQFEPKDLTISLLNENHEEVVKWDVIKAIPKRWEVSGFHAEQNNVVIETFVLSYQYFTKSY